MTQQELQLELAKLLEQIGIIINEDLNDIEPFLNGEEIITYIFFIRVAEIYKAISILISTDADQVVPAQILIRSLSEYYVLLKSSIEEEGFNNRHIKNAHREKEKWLEKVLRHHPESGFEQDTKDLKKMKEEIQQFQKEYEKVLQPTYKLFEDRKELSMYLNVYAPASIYVHGNRQSFNVYYNPDSSVKATMDRDYSSLLRHTGLAAGQIMLQSYEIFCNTINHKTARIKHIEDLLETSAAMILRSMPKDK